jgi:uncharacterized protein
MKFQSLMGRGLTALLLAVVGSAAQAQVVISQVYGGGGFTTSGGTPTDSSFTHDFVELFNRGTTAEALQGLSVQYASATGTGNFGFNSSAIVALPDLLLHPGQYFLIQMAGGSVGDPLPNPDLIGSTNLATGSGKVALVATTVSLGCNGSDGQPCSAEQLELIVDLVGYGTANFFEGSGAAPTLNNTSSAIRAGGGCIDTDDNAADFSVVSPPQPRNSVVPFEPCSVAAAPEEEPTLNIFDAFVVEGNSGDFPVMRFIARLSSPAIEDVVFDIATVDTGSAVAEVDYEANSVMGAMIETGDRDFVFEVTVIGNDTFQGDRTFAVVIENLSVTAFPGRLEATGLIVEDELAPTSICEIQSSGIDPSPLLGERPFVRGIVTAIVGNGFYVQHADDVRAADPLCSDDVSSGIFVFQGGGFNPESIGIAIGDRVSVEGTVQEFKAAGFANQFGLRQLSNFATTEILGSGNPLPTPVALDPIDDLGPDAGADRLQRYIGMRVEAPPLRVSGPSLASYNAETGFVTAFGTFFGAPLDLPRPFREPGVSVVDLLTEAPLFPVDVEPPVFDANPEALRVDTLAQQGAAGFDPDVGTVVGALRGVMTYSFSRYTLAPDVGIAPIIDTSATAQPTGIAAAPYEAFAVASLNVLNLNNLADQFDENFPVLNRRLDELSEAICAYMQTPDIIGISEAGDLIVLQKLAAAINENTFEHCDFDPQYEAHFSPSTFIGQGVGFLIARYEVLPGVPRVQGDPVRIGGEDVLLATPVVPPNPAALNDRAPLLLEAVVNQDNGAQFPVTLITNHMRSLSGLVDERSPAGGSQTQAEGWDTRGQRVREKRVQGAAWLAGVAQARQLGDPDGRLMLIGDFNAYEFSDGYVDVMGIVTGLPTAADQVLLTRSSIMSEPDPVLVDPPLLNLTGVIPQEERYTFVFEGSAQSLDHIVVNQALIDDALDIDLQHARINADFAGFKLAHPNFFERVSDHDPVVAHISVPAFRSADLALAALASASSVAVGATVEFTVTAANPGPNVAQGAQLDLSVDLPCATCPVELVPAMGWDCSTMTTVDGTASSACTLAQFGIEEAEFTLSVDTNAGFGGQAIVLSAAIASDTADRTADDNAAELTVTVDEAPEAIFANGFEQL